MPDNPLSMSESLQGMTPIEYDHTTRLVRMWIGRMYGESVAWSWQVALIVAEEIRKAAEAGKKYESENPIVPGTRPMPEYHSPNQSKQKPKNSPPVTQNEKDESGGLFD